MKTLNEPFFMSNEEWYLYDEKAPEKAKRSYIEFYKNYVFNGEYVLKSVGIEE